MAQSLKVQPFTKLDDFSSVIDDDYPYGNIETIKVKGVTSKGAQFNWKGKIKCAKKDFSDATLTDEVNFRFPYEKYTCWFGARRNGEIKFHMDLGKFNTNKKDFTLFTNLKTTTDFKKFAFRFGMVHFGKDIEASHRFETGVNGGKATSHRVVYTNKDL